MIKKLDLRENVKIIPIKGSCHDYCLAKSSVLIKINELVDAVNALIYEIADDSDWYDDVQTRAENSQPDYVTTTYMTNGHTKEYHGQNGASIVTDHPLPAGYTITIKETKGKNK